MKDQARVVIIGGGITGCSIAYHLTQMGWKDVVIVDKGELTSGATFHAAGLVGQLRASVNITKMLKYSIELYSRLEKETGQHTGWSEVGGLRIASSKDRMEELRRSAAMAKTFGLPMELISPKEACNLFPVMEKKGIVGAAFLPTDGQIDPSGVTYALAKGARDRGAEIYTDTRVTGITLKNGAIHEVITEKGKIKTEIVVNAAGIWAPEIGKMIGVAIPIIPMEHQYIITKPIDGVRRGMATMRDPDLLVYFREEVGGLIMGGYEHNPIPWGLDGIPRDFTKKLLKSNYEHFEPLSRLAMKRVPAIGKAEIITLLNGPEAFTSDGDFIMGEAAEVKNFFVAAGFCAHGIAAGGGVGKMMAEWIIEGRPSLDLWRLDIRRLGAHHASQKYALDRSIEVYAHHYSMSWPYEEMKSARPLRMSPLYYRLKGMRAVFGEKSGWERPNWFAPKGVPAKDILGWGLPNWFKHVGREHQTIRTKAGIIDQTSFGKIEVKGPGALSLLQRITDNQMDKPVGSVTYTQMLNERGGIECDLSVSRIAEDHFYLVTGTAFIKHDLSWIQGHLPEDRAVTVNDISSSKACITLCGPQARNILKQLTKDDISNESFPYMTCKQITLGYAPVLAIRITYVGELGWELHLPTEYALHVYDALWEAGKPFGLANAGYRCIDSLRLEKGYRYWSGDISPEYTPFEAGLDFCVKMDKGDFIGRDALLTQKQRGINRRLCCLTIQSGPLMPVGKEAILDGDKVIGIVTSGGFGHTIKKPIAYGYLPMNYSKPGTRLQIEVAAKRYDATVEKEPLYDPENKKVKA
ncbi:MAG: GcvT family protein [Thermodesulfobacteriota bacterium]